MKQALSAISVLVIGHVILYIFRPRPFNAGPSTFLSLTSLQVHKCSAYSYILYYHINI